jgi:hypothetical protein
MVPKEDESYEVNQKLENSEIHNHLYNTILLRALVAVTLYWFHSLYLEKNLWKKSKKPHTTDALYLDEGVENE